MKGFIYGMVLISGWVFRVCAGEPVFSPVSIKGVSFRFPETYIDPAFNRLKFAQAIRWPDCALPGK